MPTPVSFLLSSCFYRDDRHSLLPSVHYNATYTIFQHGGATEFSTHNVWKGLIELNVNVGFNPSSPTFHLVQCLEYDAVTDLTPGIWSHVRLKMFEKNSSVKKLKTNNLHRFLIM
ncbi:hypothetical protein J6590_028542 [Homalodisca vitripennis]|nr:hypothetical protein J6590_028542 [Homalodisca vitripennis]